MQYYTDEETRDIFRNYVINDFDDWNDFDWERIDPKFFSDVQADEVYRGTKGSDEVITAKWSNGTTDIQSAQEFAWDYYLNRELEQNGKTVSLYALSSHNGMICLRKVFDEDKTVFHNEEEVILRDAVWRRVQSWAL